MKSLKANSHSIYNFLKSLGKYSSLILVGMFTFPLATAQVSSKKLGDTSMETPISIGVLLPYQAQYLKQTEFTNLMLDYTTGFNMALEDMQKSGFKFTALVDFWDTDPSDSLPGLQGPVYEKQLALQLNKKAYDILIGPVYEKSFQSYTSLINPKPHLWVSPLREIKITNGLPQVNLFMSDSLKPIAVAKTVVLTFPNHRHCIVTDGSSSAKKKGTIMETVLKKELKKGKNVSVHTYKNGVFTPPLPKKKDSLIISVCSEDIKLRLPISKEIESAEINHSYVIGDISWFEDSRFYTSQNQFNCLYPTINYVDIVDSSSIDFAQRFFKKNLAEPSKFAYIGYDQAKFLLNNFLMYNKHLEIAEKSRIEYGLINNFSLSKSFTKFDDATWINAAVRLVRIDNNMSELFKP